MALFLFPSLVICNLLALFYVSLLDKIGTMKTDIGFLKEQARLVRRDALRMIHGAKSGHPGGALSAADYLVALYFYKLRAADSFSMTGEGEDVFFLSNGHISAAWYSVLARFYDRVAPRRYFNGLGILASFRKYGSPLQGHPTPVEHFPGVRVASGSLGQGLSVATGVALAKHLSGDEHFTYVLLGDGELQEGQIWEAALFAAAKKLNHLIAAVDWNDQQIDGPVHEVSDLGDLCAKWRSFGWQPIVVEGNDMEKVVAALDDAEQVAVTGSQPVVLLLKTHMGAGVDFMYDKCDWHGKAPNDEQLAAALLQLGGEHLPEDF